MEEIIIEFNDGEFMLEGVLSGGDKIIIEIHEYDQDGGRKAVCKFLSLKEDRELGEWLLKMSEK